jgi:hypothetical protein
VLLQLPREGTGVNPWTRQHIHPYRFTAPPHAHCIVEHKPTAQQNALACVSCACVSLPGSPLHLYCYLAPVRSRTAHILPHASCTSAPRPHKRLGRRAAEQPTNQPTYCNLPNRTAHAALVCAAPFHPRKVS